jgi:pyruvate dehydrogenase complex dehydrogenase (E1) component
MVLAALHGLILDGAISAEVAQRAIAELDIDPEAPDPMRA